jgi:transcriptional regulator with XRE-family HTH domain
MLRSPGCIRQARQIMAATKAGANRAIPTDAYRDAVREIIAAIRRSTGASDRQLAARIGCSASTIRNARHMTSSIDPTLLLRLGQEFGPGAIDPFLALANSRAVPLPQGVTEGDPLLAIVTALHRIIEAEARDSEGGRRITRTELRRVLDDLKRGRAALDGLIARAGGS